MKFESKYLFQCFKEDAHLLPARPHWSLLSSDENSVNSDHTFILKIESKLTLL